MRYATVQPSKAPDLASSRNEARSLDFGSTMSASLPISAHASPALSGVLVSRKVYLLWKRDAVGMERWPASGRQTWG